MSSSKASKFQLNALPKKFEDHKDFERGFGEFDIVNLQGDKVLQESLRSPKSNFMDKEFLKQTYDTFSKVEEVF